MRERVSTEAVRTMAHECEVRGEDAVAMALHELLAMRQWMRDLADSPLAEQLPTPAPCHTDPGCPCTHDVCPTCGMYDHPFIGCREAGAIHHRCLEAIREERDRLRATVGRVRDHVAEVILAALDTEAT